MGNNMLKYFTQLKWFLQSTELATDKNKKFFQLRSSFSKNLQGKLTAKISFKKSKYYLYLSRENR